MSFIEIKNVTFAYAGSYDNVFENLDLRLDTSWRLGVTGRNGKGKTTLLKLLCGDYSYTGQITAKVDFAYFPYALADENCTVSELAEQICPLAAAWEVERELSLLRVDESVLYRPFSTLSKGEQTKVQLAFLFLKENAFLLIDEPTNHLDAAARQKLGEYLRRKPGFILVSHDRALLDACTDHTLCIKNTGIEIIAGSFSAWYRQKQQQDRHEIAENERLQKEIGKLRTAARRTADWSNRVESSKKGSENSGLKVDRGYVGHKSAKMMQRAKNLERRQTQAIEQKQALLHDIDTAEPLKLSPLPTTGTQLVELRDISIAYGGRTVCDGVRLTLRPGDRIAVTGRNGCGKSSLLKLICGMPVPHTGTLHTKSGLVISYLPQDTAGLSGTLTEFCRNRGLEESLCKTILRKLGFARVQFEKDMSAFSAGQKKKTLLAASLCERAHLYVWDEPLNYIDLFSRLQIEELLCNAQPTMLFVEHDAAFCRNIATGEFSLD